MMSGPEYPFCLSAFTNSRIFTSPSPSGTSAPHWPATLGRRASLTWTDRISGPENLDGSNRVAHVVEQHVGGIKINFEVRHTQLVEREPEKVCRLLTGLECQCDPLGRGQSTRLTQSC